MPQSKRYAVKEVFGPTLQGEASMAGMPVRFLRFAGCNMWDGRPETRASSHCVYCDTDFYGGMLMTSSEIIAALRALGGSATRWVWISGGEPLLQLDGNLIMDLKDANYLLGVETNGTKPLPIGMRPYIDHLVCSPKVPWPALALHEANTLKLLFPHPNPLITPEAMRDFGAHRRYLQPIEEGGIDSMVSQANLNATIKKLYELQGWQLSLQTHKILGVD